MDFVSYRLLLFKLLAPWWVVVQSVSLHVVSLAVVGPARPSPPSCVHPLGSTLLDRCIVNSRTVYYGLFIVLVASCCIRPSEGFENDSDADEKKKYSKFRQAIPKPEGVFALLEHIAGLESWNATVVWPAAMNEVPSSIFGSLTPCSNSCVEQTTKEQLVSSNCPRRYARMWRA